MLGLELRNVQVALGLGLEGVRGYWVQQELLQVVVCWAAWVRRVAAVGEVVRREAFPPGMWERDEEMPFLGQHLTPRLLKAFPLHRRQLCSELRPRTHVHTARVHTQLV